MFYVGTVDIHSYHTQNEIDKAITIFSLIILLLMSYHYGDKVVAAFDLSHYCFRMFNENN